MLRLIIGNSVSRLEGLSRDQHKSLAKELSYVVDAYGGRRYRKTLLGKCGDFPTGLLGRVRNWPEAAVDRAALEDARAFPTNRVPYVMTLPFHPYWEQDQAAIMGCRKHRGTVVMPTAFGKSVTMALLIRGLSVKALVVVPNLELKKQLSASFASFFGETAKYITVENIDSPALKNLKDFDCLIIDEAHHVAAKTYRRLNAYAWNGIFYRFFFTATPFRSNTEEQILFESVAGQEIYRVEIKDAINNGHVAPVEAYYVDLPKIPVEGVTWREVYKELVVGRQDRNKLIAELLGTLKDVPTVCLVKEIAHGNALAELSGCVFVSGQDDDTRMHILEFALAERKCLIGTQGILGEGVDTKPAEYVLIAGLGRSKSAFMQQVGRGMRVYPGKTSCKVILFRDRSHKYTLRHFNAQRNILLDEYGAVPIKLELGRK